MASPSSALSIKAAQQTASGGPFDPAWQKATRENWWLYPTGDGTTCTPPGSCKVPDPFPGNSTMNNTNFGPNDINGKNWIRWKADFDYGFDVVGDANDAPNSFVDGFYQDAVFWTPRSRGDWNRDGITDCNEPPPDAFQPCNA